MDHVFSWNKQTDVLKSITAIIIQLRYFYESISIYKWGCDGPSAQFKYNISKGIMILFILIVPLKVVYNTNTIVWQNQRPSSTAFSRHIEIIFKKEMRETVLHEVSKIKEYIQQLQATNVCIEGYVFFVSHELHFTTVDGNISNYLTKTPSL